MNKITPTSGERPEYCITSDFQRGDDTEGVWNQENKSKFIDSVMKKYGIGLITIVRPNEEHKFYILDGGNRLRTIRDFKKNLFKWNSSEPGTKSVKLYYKDLPERDQARFDSTQLPCQIVTIQPSDPDNTISDMFIRLNTSSVPLKSGELCKAHGYQHDIWEIEVAKSIIGDTWRISGVNDPRLADIREKWCHIIGEIKEDTRCGTLAFMIGFIISSLTGKIRDLAPTKAFTAWSSITNMVDGRRTPCGFRKIYSCDFTSDMDKVVSSFNKFLDIISELNTSATTRVLSKKSMGKPKTIKIAFIWHVCISDSFQVRDEDIIHFYNRVRSDEEPIWNKYTEVLESGGDSHATLSKMEKVTEIIMSMNESRGAASE